MSENTFPQVSVLLSTYQGARFLPEQLDSLFAQTYPAIKVAVRDDGSDDETLGILQDYSQKYPGLQIEGGKRSGFVRSFFKLLADADSQSEYFAFCDQDDVWEPNKVEAAVAALSTYGGRPAMYCCGYAFIDEAGRFLGKSYAVRELGVGNALLENVALGCTMVLNRAARDVVLSCLPDLSALPTHDWWIYLVLAARGEVCYDPEPYLRYRQHSSNQSGGHPNPFRLAVMRATRVWAGRRKPFPHLWQSQELSRCHGNFIPPEKLNVVRQFLDGCGGNRGRIRLACSDVIWRQSRVSETVSRLRIALGIV